MAKFVVVSFEAAFEIEGDMSRTIQSAVDGLRSEGHARVTDFKVLEEQKDFDEWYGSAKRLQEMELPSPGTITVSWD